MTKISSILFLVLSFFGSCTSNVVNKKGLESYIANESNGLRKTLIDGQIKLELIYQPVELVWYRDLDTHENKTYKDSLLRQNSNRYYFLAKYISKNNSEFDPLSQLVSNTNLYQKILQNLSSEFENFVTMEIDPQEKLTCNGSMFSKSYGLFPYNLVLFYFEDPRINDLDQLSIKIKDVGFGIGTQNIVIKMQDIEDMPRLKI